jgi:catechol 2,3-dioxygenase-like lactoylglutathione lyase family enzyme
MIQQIDHINIVVSDLEGTTRFFLDLGFEKMAASGLSGRQMSTVTGLADIEAEYVALRLPGADTHLELIQYFSPPGGKDSELCMANRLGFRHLAFSVDDIEAVVQMLKAKDVEFLSDIQTWKQTGKKLVYFYGPDDILLELAQYAPS